jgi:dihydroneopterin aldolase
VDRILVPALPLQARVGVREEERSVPQAIVVDVELHLDLSPAGREDDLARTVDYRTVCALLDEVARSGPFVLIEAVAERMAGALLERFAVEEVRVRVSKPGALQEWRAPYAAVEVWRRRDG